MVHLRYGAANRDERQFECPRDVKLDRKRPRGHLAFGVGAHHCLGAPLARRELYFGFKALVDRVDELWYTDREGAFEYRPSYFLRIMDRLQVGFRPAATRARTTTARSADTTDV